MHPPAELRHRLGSKIVMTRLADERAYQRASRDRAGRLLRRALALAQNAGLGDDLVVEALMATPARDVLCAGQRDWDHTPVT